MSTGAGSRMSFLVQASESVLKATPTLSQYYGQVLTTISEKCTTKLDFTLKRSMCKGCRIVLVPGVNCTYRLKKKRSKKGFPKQIITCRNCSTFRSLIMKPDVKLKNEVEGVIIPAK